MDDAIGGTFFEVGVVGRIKAVITTDSAWERVKRESITNNFADKFDRAWGTLPDHGHDRASRKHFHIPFTNDFAYFDRIFGAKILIDIEAIFFVVFESFNTNSFVIFVIISIMLACVGGINPNKLGGGEL